MAINVDWQDENGNCIEPWPDYALPWDRYFWTDPEVIAGTRCLSFTDHHGDTTFNQFQIPVLAEELESYKDRCREDAEFTAAVESLIAFVRKADGHIHTYVKFWGD